MNGGSPCRTARKEAYGKIIRICRENRIVFCFALHPQMASPRPLDPRMPGRWINFTSTMPGRKASRSSGSASAWMIPDGVLADRVWAALPTPV